MDCSLSVKNELMPKLKGFKYLKAWFKTEGKMNCEIDRQVGAEIVQRVS